MKEFGRFILGIILMIVGAVVLLQNISISGFSLYRYGSVPVGGLIVLLLFISFIVLLVKPNVGTGIIFGLLCIVALVCLILSLNIHIKHMSALMLVLILGTIGVGVALVIRSVFGISKSSKN